MKTVKIYLKNGKSFDVESRYWKASELKKILSLSNDFILSLVVEKDFKGNWKFDDNELVQINGGEVFYGNCTLAGVGDDSSQLKIKGE